jgi:rubrerythrin
VLTSGAFFAMLPELATAKPSRKQDIKILQYALVLERLEAAFYKEAASDGGLSGPQLEFATLVADHEATHVTALRQTIRSLGAKPAKAPKFDFKGANTGDKFAPTAFVLENTGVRAYLGQARRLKSKQLLAAAASIVTVEARHAAAIATLIDSSQLSGKHGITPSGAFDRASSMKTILGEVGATGFIVS